MPQPSPRLPERIYLWCWRRPWFKKQFYNALNLILGGQPSVTMLNCGYMEPGAPKAAQDAEDASFELYRRLLDPGTPRMGEVLELGCGRGGGTAFIHRELAARRTVGLDFAAASVRWCRRHHRHEGLEFVAGDAGKPPFAGESFDVVIAVEVTHCLKDKHGFLAEVARVLRPGGRLLVADFFYCRPDSSHAIGAFEAALAASPLHLEATEDWTAAAVAAIEANSDQRERVIRRSVPRMLQGVALGFASTTQSSTYHALREKRAVYRRFALRKQASN